MYKAPQRVLIFHLSDFNKPTFHFSISYKKTSLLYEGKKY
jgi:hypothetical protein